MDRRRQPQGARAVRGARRRAALLALLALGACWLAWAAWAGTAGAEDSPAPGDPAPPADNRPVVTISVRLESGPEGVTIYIDSETLTPGSPGSPGSPGGPSLPSCSASPVNVGNHSIKWVLDGIAANPGTFPWAVTCSTGDFGIAWVPNDAGYPSVVVEAPALPPVDPARVRASAMQIVGLPAITVGVNPAVGLAGLPSWFWVEGYAGGTLSGSASLDGASVDVEIRPQGYEWSFGDGATLSTASLGRAYPQQSDVRHTYERSSHAAGGAYAVELAITWSARYRENGGAWQPLAPIPGSYTLSYPVRQLQSVLTANP